MTDAPIMANTFIQGFINLTTPLATIVLAYLTYRYVKLTNHILNETRASRGPNVYLDIELDHYQIKFIVGNSGLGPAHNIKIDVTDTISWRNDKRHSGFKSLRIVKDGIGYLAPNRTLKYLAGYYDWKSLLSTESYAQFTLSYDDHLKNHQTLDIYFDMNQYKEVLFETFKKPESEIAEAIKQSELSRSAEKAASRFSLSLGSKPCPQCRETISISAKKCPHCHEFLHDEQKPTSS